MSKNLFDYATKELSQDAFLMWIIDSYNSDDEVERKVSRKFIQFLTGINEDEILTEVWIKAQWYKIDVTAFITTETGRNIGIFIEDKTTSFEHNQLEDYNKSINKIIQCENGKISDIKKVFYKTNTIYIDESERIKHAGWNEISFENINEFWTQFINVDNIIISQYAKHVTKIYKDSKNVYIPTENNIISWVSYFKDKLVPIFEKKCDCWGFTTRFNYACFACRPLGRGNEKMPYLEIRSRDCLNGVFNAKILMYDVDYTNNPDGLKIIRDEIWKRERGGLYKGNYGKKHNKQVAHISKEKLLYKNENEFIANVNKCIEEYLDIVAFWQNNKKAN